MVELYVLYFVWVLWLALLFFVAVSIFIDNGGCMIMCNEFVCSHRDRCIYGISSDYDCLHHGCLIALSAPCAECLLKRASCQRKRTTSLNSSFANSAPDYSQELEL